MWHYVMWYDKLQLYARLTRTSPFQAAHETNIHYAGLK